MHLMQAKSESSANRKRKGVVELRTPPRKAPQHAYFGGALRVGWRPPAPSSGERALRSPLPTSYVTSINLSSRRTTHFPGLAFSRKINILHQTQYHPRTPRSASDSPITYARPSAA